MAQKCRFSRGQDLKKYPNYKRARPLTVTLEAGAAQISGRFFAKNPARFLNSNVQKRLAAAFFVFVLVPSLSWQSLCLDCAAVERVERGALLLNFTFCFVFERLP